MDRDEWRVAELRKALRAYVDASRRAADVPGQPDRDAAALDAERPRETAWLLTDQGEAESVEP
jgi:hypothetical protein